MSGQASLGLKPVPSAEKDIFLCHNAADKQWVEMLAERIEREPFGNRNLGVVFDKWDFQKGGNIVLDMERFLDSTRFVGVVVSRAMLNAEWPTLERTIAVWSDPSGARGRVIPLQSCESIVRRRKEWIRLSKYPELTVSYFDSATAHVWD